MLLKSLVATFRPEMALLRAYQAREEKSPGLELALRYACRDCGSKKAPNILIYQDTLPSARVARSFLGSGTLILSQGLVASFRDDEIVAVMRRGLGLLSQRGVSFKTLCSAWFVELEKSHRKPWTPLRAITLWTLLPLRNFLKRQDQKLDVFRASPSESAFEDRNWRDALRKVSCSERIFS